MNLLNFTGIVLLAALFGVVFGLLLIAYEDGKPFGLYRRIKCKFGKHTFRIGFRNRTNKYFCQQCKVPRKHPALKAIDGGNKVNNFKF